MRVLCLLVVFLPLLCVAGPAKMGGRDYDLREGDIVFQATGGRQCEVIRAATGSPWSHCGVVFASGGRLYVLEAVSPVRSTPLQEWYERSLAGTFHARRLAAATGPPDEAVVRKAQAWARRQVGKPYDLRFLWSDEELYCSELVWKLFKTAGGVELCKPRRFDSFNLEPTIVQRMIVERFGSRQAFPSRELVVAPHDLATSPLLCEVPRRSGKKR